MKKIRIIVACIIIFLLSANTFINAATPDINPFSDVSADRWYYVDVLRAREEGIMLGTSEDKFEPDATVTREMFVTALARMSVMSDSIKTGDYTEYSGKFEDDWISGFWYSSSIAWADKFDIVNGVSENKFGLGIPVTREQIATFIYRYLNAFYLRLKNSDTPASAFVDTPSEYAKEAVELMRLTGIIRGVGNDRFDPKAHAARAEVAAILLRLKDAIKTSSNYGITIDTQKIGKIVLRDMTRFNDGPYEINVTDKEEIKKLTSYINDANVTDVKYVEATGWTYDVQFYDTQGKFIYGLTVRDSQYEYNSFVFTTKEGNLKPLIDYIKAN